MNTEALAPETNPAGDENPSCELQDLPQHAGPLEHDSPIFLVGMMGAGKTTIGKALARVLQREFIDLDHELEARCGVRIPVIFEIEGEQGFRKRECQVLDDCTVRPNLVMATGGGAVLADENRRALQSRGIVVYLRASVEELFRRTSRDRNRPLLVTPDPKATLRSLLELREPLYTAVADVVVDGHTGYVVAADEPSPFVDACVRLLTDPALRQSQGVQAADRARAQFSIEAMARQYCQLFDRSSDAEERQP
jgi:shikimate kinase